MSDMTGTDRIFLSAPMILRHEALSPELKASAVEMAKIIVSTTATKDEQAAAMHTFEEIYMPSAAIDLETLREVKP